MEEIVLELTIPSGSTYSDEKVVVEVIVAGVTIQWFDDTGGRVVFALLFRLDIKLEGRTAKELLLIGSSGTAGILSEALD